MHSEIVAEEEKKHSKWSSRSFSVSCYPVQDVSSSCALGNSGAPFLEFSRKALGGPSMDW